MQENRNLLRKALVLPDSLTSLTTAEWDRLITHGRRAVLLARLESLLAQRGLLDRIPKPVRTHLESARTIAENEQRVMLWEVNRIQRALAEIETPIVLLKGAAYAIAGLPLARGRLSSDVDILVPQQKLHAVEERLLQHGWDYVKLEQYDQYFYRTWSHELPPLQHRDRKTIVDVHHTILPPTGRLHPDPEKLIAAALSVEGTKLKVLAPVDMVLHSAAHAFQDGDLQRGLRDLVDLDDLFRYFGSAPHFWAELMIRAQELELTRPLFYALCYTDSVLDTPIPSSVLDACLKWAPAWPVPALMDKLVHDAAGAEKRFMHHVSLWALYLRSHWLRMPPFLLVPHLIRKSLMRCSVNAKN
jgi:hypothetical protein